MCSACGPGLLCASRTRLEAPGGWDLRPRYPAFLVLQSPWGLTPGQLELEERAWWPLVRPCC